MIVPGGPSCSGSRQAAPALAQAGRFGDLGQPADRTQPPPRPRVFRIQVVDAETGRGVPLVELKTVSQIRYITDSNGVAAFDEPGLFNRKVFFFITSHGYEAAKDGFGYRGQALEVTEGGTLDRDRRLNIAQRLYRVTAGIRGTASRPATDRSAALLNGWSLPGQRRERRVSNKSTGSGRHEPPRLSAGQFSACRRRPIAGQGWLDPKSGVNLSYILDDRGFARPTAPMPGDGPTWISGLIVLRDRDARERMFAIYVKVRNMLEVYQHGLVEYNPETRRFEKVVQFPEATAHPGDYPSGHPFLFRDQGVEYVYYANPYPLIRVPADPEQLKNAGSFRSSPASAGDHARAATRSNRTAGATDGSENPRSSPGSAEQADRLRPA